MSDAVQLQSNRANPASPMSISSCIAWQSSQQMKQRELLLGNQQQIMHNVAGQSISVDGTRVEGT